MQLNKIFSNPTKKQCSEFGLVAVLASLFFALYLHKNNFVVIAFIVTLVTIIAPVLFYPFAIAWFGLSKGLGAVSSTILMSLVFFAIVVPVGLFRKLLGKDNLKIRQFKKGNQSVMIERNHLYSEADLLNSF